MATSTLQSIINSVDQGIKSLLDSIGTKAEKTCIDVLKKTRNLKDGDIIIPAGKLKLLNEMQALQLQASIKSLLLQDQCFVKNVKSDSYSWLAIHLNRAEVCRSVFSQIVEQGSSYGFQISTGQNIILNTASNIFDRSLKTLRLIVVRSHLKRLLEANGYNVLCQNDLHDLNWAISSHNATEEKIKSNPKECPLFELKTQLELKLESSGLCLNRLQLLSEDPSGDALPNTVVLNLKEVIQDNKLRLGKDGFSKNLDNVKIINERLPTEVLSDVVRQTELLTSIALNKSVCGVLHLVVHSQSYRQQQIQLVRLVLSRTHLPEAQLLVGPMILKNKKNDETAQSFYETRFKQMNKASEMRYGCNMDAAELSRRVRCITLACMKVDILSNDASNELQLDMRSCDQLGDSKLGAFILYNTARLSSLLAQFEHKVLEGYYPPLPPVADVDFSLLREEEDWEIVFLYIAEFPTLVQQTVESIFSNDGGCFANIHTHKVTKFLASFCKCLSAHYNRYHILSGKEDHLLPLMFARLYLVKSSLRVLLNCLHLLDLEPLDEL